MKTADIPTEPILKFLAEHQGEWATWFGSGIMPDVASAIPCDAPRKLVLAKMAKLIRKGLVSGCSCGCRGDFEITDRGLVRIGLKREKAIIG